MTHEWQHVCYKSGFDKHVETLTPSQKAFPYLLHAWIQNPKHTLIIVAGGPGTGKTYTVVQSLNFVQVPQLRMAPTARVAQKMNGSTLHSALRLQWGEGSVLNRIQKELELETEADACIAKSRDLLNEFNCRWKPQIIVMDEVGMMTHWLIHWIIRYFFQTSKPKLFIVMGDPNQLRPVKSQHNIFNATLHFDNTRIDLLESKRFTQSYEHIIKRLRDFVDVQDKEGMLAYLCECFPVVERIDSTLLEKCTRAMAYLKSSVEAYNAFYLKYMVPGPKLRLYRDGSSGDEKQETFVDVKTGCQVFVTQNGVSSALNGTCLIFETYNKTLDVVECSDPALLLATPCLQLKQKNHRILVHRNTNGEFPIVVGFAATVHKFQGETMDDEAIVINFNESTDLNLIYTALSRVKSMSQVLAIQL